MKFGSKAALLTLALSLNACCHYSEDLSSLEGQMSKTTTTTFAKAVSPEEVQPAAGNASFNTSEFNGTLAREYYDMATFENQKAFDYKAAKEYTQKAMTASKGEATAPFRISSFDIPSERIPELAEARKSLVSAIKSSSTAGNELALAKAQSSFDCWVERAEEATNEKHYAQCKADYEQAMASLTAPAAGNFATPNVFDIAFAQNGATVDGNAAPSIEQAAAFLKSPQGEGYTVVLTGFTETTTASDFATKLATDRVWAVRDALVAKGIANERIKPQLSSTPGVTPAAAQTGTNAGGLGRKVQIFLSAPISATPAATTQNAVAPAPATIAQ